MKINLVRNKKIIMTYEGPVPGTGDRITELDNAKILKVESVVHIVSQGVVTAVHVIVKPA